MKYIVIALIRFYQRFVSPVFGQKCRFIPTCSQYAIEALQKYGFFKGSWLAIKRICKCNPFSKGGYDPLK